MSFESVDIFVRDTTPQQLPIEGLLVRVFGADGKTFFNEILTDSNGRAGFTLNSANYTLRFFKNQVNVVQPQQITVLSNPPAATPNDFNISGIVHAPPAAVDPRLCKASGFFRDVSGSPKKFLDIMFIAKFCPLVLEGAAVVTERQTIRTDEDGFGCIELIRNGQYNITMESFEDCLRMITIPDQASVNLPDLLFPVVEEVVFSPLGPYAIKVGSELEVTLTPTVIASSGLVLDGAATQDVRYTSSDDSILAVLPTTDVVVIRGIAAGTAQIQAERLDQSIVRIPDTPIQGFPITVTVT